MSKIIGAESVGCRVAVGLEQVCFKILLKELVQVDYVHLFAADGPHWYS
jgi:hypothetical protein